MYTIRVARLSTVKSVWSSLHVTECLGWIVRNDTTSCCSIGWRNGPQLLGQVCKLVHSEQIHRQWNKRTCNWGTASTVRTLCSWGSNGHVPCNFSADSHNTTADKQLSSIAFSDCSCSTRPFSNCLTFQVMVNREAGNPDVLDSYIGPDIIAASQPLTFLGPFIVTITRNTLRAKYRVKAPATQNAVCGLCPLRNVTF